MPSALMRDARVVGFMDKSAAAPPPPYNFPSACSRAARMFSRSRRRISSSVTTPVVGERAGTRGSLAFDGPRFGGSRRSSRIRVGGELLPEAVECLDRQAARVDWSLHHDGRHGADEHQLGDAALAVARDVACCFAAAGRMADVDRVAQIEMRDDSGGVRRVVAHVVPIADLARAAMAPPVMSNDAIPSLHEVEPSLGGFAHLLGVV